MLLCSSTEPKPCGYLVIPWKGRPCSLKDAMSNVALPWSNSRFLHRWRTLRLWLLHNCYSSVYSSTIGLMSSRGDVSIAKIYNIHMYLATLHPSAPTWWGCAADLAASSTVQKSRQKLLEVGMLGSRLVARGRLNGSIEPPWVTDCHEVSRLARDAAFCVQWTVWLVYMHVYNASQYICIDAFYLVNTSWSIWYNLFM